MNYITVFGNLGRDPEIRTTKDGREFMTFSVADNQYINSKTETQWFDVTVFDQMVIKRFKDHLKKGSYVAINGSFYNRVDVRDGKYYSHNIFTAKDIQYASSSSGSTSNQQVTVSNSPVQAPVVETVQMNSQPAPAPIVAQSVEDEQLPF